MTCAVAQTRLRLQSDAFARRIRILAPHREQWDRVGRTNSVTSPDRLISREIVFVHPHGLLAGATEVIAATAFAWAERESLRTGPHLCAGQWEATVSRCMQENLTSRGCAPGVRRRTPVQIVTSAPASKRCGAAGRTISARAPFAAYQARRLAGTLRPRATCLPAGQTPRPGRGWVLAASGPEPRDSGRRRHGPGAGLAAEAAGARALSHASHCRAL
jgi:hypothetical protein